jgi:hypothetical protein
LYTSAEVAVARNVLPACRDDEHQERPGYLFSARHYDNALRIEAEMLVGVARELLYQPDRGADPFDTPTIRQRRSEAARACLDVLWAMMSERNTVEGEPTLVPALVRYTEELRPRCRLKRS